MSVFDGKRLPASTFKLDAVRMRHGWYSDKYFVNVAAMLAALAERSYRFAGTSPLLPPNLGAGVHTGNLRVEMQWFTRRQPFSIVVGIDKALAMLKECTGYNDEHGQWVSTSAKLEVLAVQDGFVAPSDGNPLNATPVLKVRGRYRDFALLETPTLGALTRGTRVATNVYEVLRAARGKEVLFFPARFDAHEVQAGDGYAYHTAVQVFNQTFGRTVRSTVSTDEQGDWWGGAGGGTVAHAAIACFLGDTAEAMRAFAAVLPVSVPRIALVDFNNDCVGDSVKTAKALFCTYQELTDAGQTEEAQRFVLYGVRLDTSGALVDRSLEPSEEHYGVNPMLVHAVRNALDSAWQTWEIPDSWRERAAAYCRAVKISVTGGFSPAKIRKFEDEKVPVDVYGVGSHLFSNASEVGTNNDFTADVVRVEINGQWHDLAKTGRHVRENPDMKPVSLADL